MNRPRVLIFSGYGLNCEEETKYAFELAGAKADIVHINDLISDKKKLFDYRIAVFPGGFSYGDDTGSGNAFANKVRNHLWKEMEVFIQKDTLILGICNGFQILVNLGLLPALNNKYGDRQVALMPNNTARYIVRWVDLKEENDSPWIRNVNDLSLPIAHGEGRFYGDKKTLDQLKENKQIVLRYVKGEVCKYQSLDANPNGSVENIAGIVDPTKRIFGLMPHPERAIFFTQKPNWPYLKETYKRLGKKLPEHGPGLQIFKNAVKYLL